MSCGNSSKYHLCHVFVLRLLIKRENVRRNERRWRWKYWKQKICLLIDITRNVFSGTHEGSLFNNSSHLIFQVLMKDNLLNILTVPGTPIRLIKVILDQFFFGRKNINTTTPLPLFPNDAQFWPRIKYNLLKSGVRVKTTYHSWTNRQAKTALRRTTSTPSQQGGNLPKQKMSYLGTHST